MTKVTNSIRVALVMLESTCETLGLADALEPNEEESTEVNRYLRIWKQDEESMCENGMAHSGMFNK